ncbi:MAG: GGDEF domain-containing protein, partial [Eubacterium sp.]|nr:GGDEF domain-containing protein [Eubacterium sp.]
YVVVVDINDLKTVNDTWGHGAGDELITGVSDCIRKAFEDEQSACYRLGGDEFAVITRSSEAELQGRINFLRNRIGRWMGSYGAGASIALGAATAADGKDFASVVRTADERMYADKRRHYSQTRYNRRKSDVQKNTDTDTAEEKKS